MKKIIIMILALSLIVGGCSALTKEETPPDANVVEEDVIKEDIVEAPDEAEVSQEDFDIATGKEAPDFTLKNLAGEEVSLSDYRGKIVLINFWATWCSWCDIEMPDLQKLDEENDDLVVLAVDVQEKKETVEEYIEKGGYTFEVVLDEEGEVAKTYLVSAFPTSYFVDEEGILLGRVPGAMTHEQMTAILESIREGK